METIKSTDNRFLKKKKSESLRRKASKVFHFLHGNRTVKIEDLHFWMLHGDQFPVYSEHNYYGSQVYV